MRANVSIEYSVEFLTPFHFGTGLSSGTLDRLVRRDADEYLIIPASTVKGVVREKVEKLIQIFKELQYFSEPVTNIFEKEEHLNFFRQNTLVDRLFGSPKMDGTLFFDNLCLNEASKDFVSIGDAQNQKPANYLQTQQRTQTRIMRTTKSVAPGALFKSEYGNPNLVFLGNIKGQIDGIKIRIVSIPGMSYELVLLLFALKMIDKIGGNKTIGMGNISIQIDNLILNDNKLELNEIFSNEIWENLEVMYEEDKEVFLNEN